MAEYGSGNSHRVGDFDFGRTEVVLSGKRKLPLQVICGHYGEFLVFKFYNFAEPASEDTIS